MGIFDYINDILYNKSGKVLAKKEFESDFQPYMIQRWLSMHSSINVRILAASTNKLYNAVTDKEQWYKLFLCTIPRSKYTRFSYIKKKKVEKTAKQTNVDLAIEVIAQEKQISKREVREYIEEYGLDVSAIASRMKEK